MPFAWKYVTTKLQPGCEFLRRGDCRGKLADHTEKTLLPEMPFFQVRLRLGALRLFGKMLLVDTVLLQRRRVDNELMA